MELCLTLSSPSLSEWTAQTVLPPLEWCPVPAGEVSFDHGGEKTTYAIDPFRISKYPITHEQYQVFLDTPDGYGCERNWKQIPGGQEWHNEHPQPLDAKFAGHHYPRVNICWYEAAAFCHWLSEKLSVTISLPTEYQWQRAAQGDIDQPYPWGEAFDPNRCNTLESRFRSTTPVDRYPNGASPYGVYDLVGNVWEWCSTWRSSNETSILEGEIGRVVRGGSFVSPAHRVNNFSYFILKPIYRYVTIGFRVVGPA